MWGTEGSGDQACLFADWTDCPYCFRAGTTTLKQKELLKVWVIRIYSSICTDRKYICAFLPISKSVSAVAFHHPTTP